MLVPDISARKDLEVFRHHTVEERRGVSQKEQRWDDSRREDEGDRA
jgi:hypothetical protein